MGNFFIKLIAFVAVLLTLQVAVSAMDPPELPKEILALDQQLQEGAEIIYFGDSTLIHPVDDPTIPEMLRGLLPERKIGDVAHPAYHLDLYERYVNYLVKNEAQVEAVIIPINMHSFSPAWDLRPTYQFEREKTILTYGPLLSTVFYRPFDTFGLFDSPISQADFEEAPVFNGDQPVGEVAEFEALIGTEAEMAEEEATGFAYYDSLPSEDDIEALKGTLVYYYMYRLDRHHRKILSMKAISHLLEEQGIKPIFYITPVNYEFGEQYLGPVFRERVAENTAVVEKVLRRKGVDVLNLAFDLEAYNFVDTEHLTENGKSYVAEALAEAINTPQPAQLTSTGPVDAPTPQRTTPEPAGEPNQTPSPMLSPADPEPSGAEPTSSPAPVEIETTPQPTPTNTRVVPVTVTPQSAAMRQAGQLISAEFWTAFEPAGNYNIDVYRLRYRTVDWNDRAIEAEANLYVPQVEQRTRFPIMVYAPGTTGLSDSCAPLDEWGSGNNWGMYNSYMLEYTAQGFIGILPNYQGFADDDRPTPYFISEFQARALLDATRAAYHAFEKSPNLAARPMEAVFIAGYSSGGHAAFAAKDFAATYAPELSLKGIIGHGPTTNPETLLQEDAVFSPYIVQSYRDFYGPDVVDPAVVFQDRWVASLQNDVMSRCVDGVFRYYSSNPRQMYRPEFMAALSAGRLQTLAPAFQAALRANASGLAPEGVEIPVLILQGTADQVVTPPSQREFAASLCQLGNRVTYLSYSAVSHPNIRRASFRDTINWMESIAEGELPESNCASLTG